MRWSLNKGPPKTDQTQGKRRCNPDMAKDFNWSSLQNHTKPIKITHKQVSLATKRQKTKEEQPKICQEGQCTGLFNKKSVYKDQQVCLARKRKKYHRAVFCFLPMYWSFQRHSVSFPSTSSRWCSAHGSLILLADCWSCRWFGGQMTLNPKRLTCQRAQLKAGHEIA